MRRADLVVIGAGLAGSAAAAFAARRGKKVIQVSATSGELMLSSGVLDLLGVYPLHPRTIRENPWEGLAVLIDECPLHPYARLGSEKIAAALEELVALIASAGLRYRHHRNNNAQVITPAGTLKTTYLVPETMWPGVEALPAREPLLIVGFEGMREFSSSQIAQTLAPERPHLHHCRIPFPGAERENFLMAEALESADARKALTSALKPHVRDVSWVGFPALLGLRRWTEVISDLERETGLRIFEIPTLPPSVAGSRLNDALAEVLRREGVEQLKGGKIDSVRVDGRYCTGIVVRNRYYEELIEADGYLLATGRFLGGGLVAQRTGLFESVFGLPVFQPPERRDWHRERFLDSRGHPVSSAGVEIDDDFRPLSADGASVFENVFVAGSILAHQDWMRMKCGAGLAVSTACGAVESFVRYHGGSAREKSESPASKGASKGPSGS